MSAAFAPAVWAQAAGETGTAARLPFTVVPGFAASQTYTRNDASSPGEQRSELATLLSPSVQVRSGSGRVKGFVSYSLNSYSYSRDSSKNNVQHELAASVNAEAITNFAFVDASASVSQQAASPFGQQFSNGSTVTANRAAQRSYSVSPYVRGSVSAVVDYEARLSHSTSGSGASSQSGGTTDSGLLQVSGGSGFSRLRWSATANREVLAFKGGRKNTSDRANLSFGYQLSSQVTLSANGGRESSDYISADKQSSTTRGFGFTWQPSDATSLTGNLTRREFGNTHALNFSRRTGRTLFTYSDTRSVTNGIGQPLAVNLGTSYAVYSQLSTETDPVLRDQQVRAFLNQFGINPTAPVFASFLTSALALDRQQVLSAAWVGVRDTMSLGFSRGSTSRLDKVVAVADLLGGSSTLSQQSLYASLGHRLTPTASLSLNAAQRRIRGADTLTGAATSSRFSTLDVSWSDQIGRYTRASLSAHRGVFDSATASPYTESAVTASVSLTF